MVDPKKKYNIQLFTELLRKYSDSSTITTSNSRLSSLRVSDKIVNPSEVLEDYWE
jgi:hypothetical protein